MGNASVYLSLHLLNLESHLFRKRHVSVQRNDKKAEK